MRALVSALLAASLLRATLAVAAEPEKGGTAPAATSAVASAAPVAAGLPRTREYFTEVELVDQDGKKVLLYRDLIQGKVVILNAFFTSCESICPLVNKILTKVQTRLGDSLGRDVHIVSITLDPKVDNPAALTKYGKELGAKPGWSFVTGKKEDVDTALKELGYSVAQRENHSGILLVINEPRGLWRKAYGLSSAEDIEKILAEVRETPAIPH